MILELPRLVACAPPIEAGSRTTKRASGRRRSPFTISPLSFVGRFVVGRPDEQRDANEPLSDVFRLARGVEQRRGVLRRVDDRQDEARLPELPVDPYG